MAEPILQHGSIHEVDFNTGNLGEVDPMNEEEYSSPVLSPDPEQMRVTARKQILCGEHDKTLICGGDSDAHTKNDKTLPLKSTNIKRIDGERLSNFSFVVLLALVFRLVLLMFSTWQDQTRWPDGQLRFTDVDYDVFTDAARALVAGENIYEARPTYRYSPLIAAAIAPGHLLFGSTTPKDPSESFFEPPIRLDKNVIAHDYPVLARLWGKLLFVLADLVCAWLQYQIIQTEYQLHHHGNEKQASANWNGEQHQWATCFILFAWLFNPITAVVSVRGNAEALLGVCVLGCLLLVLKQRLILAGLMFGLCIHLKLYPVIYSPAIYLWLSRPSSSKSWFVYLRGLLPSWKHVIFGLATLTSLGLLTSWGYMQHGGMQFLWQAYLYHFTRVDIKHNFAPHFYPLYLLTGSKWKMDELHSELPLNESLAKNLMQRLQASVDQFIDGTDSTTLWDRVVQLAMENLDVLTRFFNMAAFLPAVLLIPRHSFKLYQQPGLCWFVITYVFVTFNKVCTSQYFLWSLVLLPVALPSLQLPAALSPNKAILECLLLWVGAQAFWLASAYTLEMRTQTSEVMAQFVWRLVWFASMLFLVANVVLIRRFIKWRKPCACINLENDSMQTNVSKHNKKTQ